MNTRKNQRTRKGARVKARKQTRKTGTRGGATAASVPALDYVLSLLIAMQTGAVWGRCYDNAYGAFLGLPELFFPHGTFIEGWIVFEDAGRIALMEHGWLVRGGQSIIDPTIVLVTEPAQPVYYFPGVARSWAEAEALENQLFPHVRFSDFGEDGMGHPGYKAAYTAALRRARALVVPGKELVEVRASEISQESEGGTKAAGESRVRMYLLVQSGDDGPAL
jgi:hypothetical protein